MSKIIEKLQHHAAEYPQRPALIVPHFDQAATRMSYGELAQRVEPFAAKLAARLERSEIIPVLASKSIESVVAMLGLLASGSAFAALNRKLKPPQLRSIVAQLRSPFGLIDAQHAATLAAGTLDTIGDIPWHVVAGEKPSPLQRNKIEVLQRNVRGELWRVDDIANAPLSIPRRADDSFGCCLFTSGSTGTPKGVLISEVDLSARAEAEVECFGLKASDVLLCILPLSFDVGLNQLLSAIVAGCTIVLSESWLPADILRNTARFGVTGISAVPAIWNDLLNSPLRFDRAQEHQSLRYVTVSGGDLPLTRLQLLQLATDSAGIIKTYGQSETFRSGALLPADFTRRPESVGKAFASACVYIVRDDGTRAAPNEPGEIVHTGIGTMIGYLDHQAGDDNLRANPFRGPEDAAAKAVFTGDIGWLDEEGFLFLQGRRDGMLKVAGNRVYPQEVGRQFGAFPEVGEVEIVGTKDAAGETEICAFVVPARGALLDPADLRRRLMQLLPSYMVPKQIRIVPQITRTESGKADRPALIAQL